MQNDNSGNVPSSNLQVIGSIYTGGGKDGDFGWMLQQSEYNDALFIFNDNESQFLAHRSQPKSGPGCNAGGGNAAIRPYQCQNPPRATGIPTGNGGGYTALTEEVKQYIDDAITTIRQIATNHNYKRVIYSAANTKGDLGTKIFSPAKEVTEYIVTQLKALQN